ncbi:MAG: hypothetical protein Q4Q53_09030 [Methanocorpusculum sp.]|nr:hypothetical protein [Methanocorpusculum sp.]
MGRDVRVRTPKEVEKRHKETLRAFDMLKEQQRRRDAGEPVFLG